MTTSSEETVRRLTLATAKTETGVAIWMMTEAGGEYVMGKDYDALLSERDRLRQRVSELETLLKAEITKCSVCGGSGELSDESADVAKWCACDVCAPLRLALSGEK